jgi:hypothetical protein
MKPTDTGVITTTGGQPERGPHNRTIATILTDMDTEITTLETMLAKTRSLKQGMMHNLLIGRIRLV